MGKKKNQKDKKRKKDTNGKQKTAGKAPAKQRVEEASGSRAIAKAEHALARALQQVEDARTELSLRERELSVLLEKHGRLPELLAASDDAESEPEPADANGGASEPEETDADSVQSDDAAAAEQDVVQLFDQQQVTPKD